jgi:hypothetical protein
MSGYPYGETVTRLRGQPVADPYSADSLTLDFSTPTELPIDGIAVAPVASAATATESRNALNESRAAIQDGFTLYLPEGGDITSADRVRVRGGIYRVTGQPQDWVSPLTGWHPGLVINVERVIG